MQHDTTRICALQAVNSPTAQRYTYADAVDAGVGIGVDRATPSTPVQGNKTDVYATATAPPPSEDSNSAILVGLIIAAAIVGVAAVAGTRFFRSQLLWAANCCALLHGVCWGHVRHGGGGIMSVAPVSALPPRPQ
jgi:hypothetical protein